MNIHQLIPGLEYFPSGHAVHDDDAGDLEKVLEVQLVHVDAAERENVPAGHA